jgi:hypothetical protein
MANSANMEFKDVNLSDGHVLSCNLTTFQFSQFENCENLLYI